MTTTPAEMPCPVADKPKTQAEARALIDRLKAADAERTHGGGGGVYGLRVRRDGWDDVTETPATFTLDYCTAAAEYRNARWPHQQTTVYRRGEPHPTRADVQRAEQQDRAEAKPARGRKYAKTA